MSIYLIKSNSTKQINEEISKIISSEDIIINFDMSESSLDELIEEAATFSLFNDLKFIVARNSEYLFNKINEDDQALLTRYLNSPNEQTVLIFIVNNQLKDNAPDIIKIIKDKYKYLVLQEYKVNQIYAKVEEYLNLNKIIMNRDAIYYLINNSLNNYDLVFNELEKINIYYENEEKKVVNNEDLKNIIYTSTENNIYKFINDISNRNIIDALDKLAVIKLYKVDITLISTSLAKNFRNIYNLKILRHEKNHELEAKIFNLKSWQLNILLTSTYKYQESELLNILKELGELDYKYKTGQIDGYLGLELFLLKL